MKLESVRVSINSNELEAALRSIEMPQNVSICSARFEHERLVIDLALLVPVPLHPSLHVSVTQAIGQTVSLEISAPFLKGLIDLFMSSVVSNLPNGVTYLGNGIVSLDIPALANGAVTSIDIGGIQFEEGHATVVINEVDLNILALLS